MYFKDQLGTNTAVGGVGPRFRVPDGTLVARRRPDVTSVRERDVMRRDGGDRVAFPARDRGEVRDRGDRPDRSTPTAREPERRGGDRGREAGGAGGDRDGGRAAPERRGGGGGEGRAQNGRAAGRGRVEIPGVAGSIKKKKRCGT